MMVLLRWYYYRAIGMREAHDRGSVPPGRNLIERQRSVPLGRSSPTIGLYYSSEFPASRPTAQPPNVLSLCPPTARQPNHPMYLHAWLVCLLHLFPPGLDSESVWCKCVNGCVRAYVSPLLLTGTLLVLTMPMVTTELGTCVLRGYKKGSTRSVSYNPVVSVLCARVAC